MLSVPSTSVEKKKKVTCTYHPWPQWFAVLPQFPPLEQQLPNAEPAHVLPFDPHLPSVEMLPLPPVQVPYLVWHPVPQWSPVLPQFPLDEQQLPKADPAQVLPFEPHFPSVEMLPLPVLQMPNLLWQPAPQ
jgi:hypothetical protein